MAGLIKVGPPGFQIESLSQWKGRVVRAIDLSGYRITKEHVIRNSDNYLAMPHGTGTFLLTYGENYAVLMSSFALARNWEFFARAPLPECRTSRFGWESRLSARASRREGTPSPLAP